MRPFRRALPSAARAGEDRAPFTTGGPSLDASLGGGFPKAALSLVFGGPGASGPLYTTVTAPAIVDALARGIGVVIEPPTDETVDGLFERIAPALDPEVVNGRLRIADYDADEATEPWRVPLARRAGRRRLVERMVAAERAAGGPEGRPFLEVGATDRLAAAAGVEVARQQTVVGVGRSLAHRNTSILWVPQVELVAPALRDRAAVEIELAPGPRVRGLRPAFDWAPP